MSLTLRLSVSRVHSGVRHRGVFYLGVISRIKLYSAIDYRWIQILVTMNGYIAVTSDYSLQDPWKACSPRTKNEDRTAKTHFSRTPRTPQTNQSQPQSPRNTAHHQQPSANSLAASVVPQANDPLTPKLNPVPTPRPILPPRRIANPNIRHKQLRRSPVANSQEAQLRCAQGDDVVGGEFDGAAVVGA